MEMIMGIGYLIYHNILSFLSFVGHSWFSLWAEMSPIAMGVLLQIIVVLLLIGAYKMLMKSKFSTLFELFVEEIYKFFEEIFEDKAKKWVKVYVVTLFFVILLSNLSSWILDIIRVMFTDVNRLTSVIQIPTTSFEFNIALAVVSIVLFLFVQLKHLKFWKFIHEYFPITGKGILDIEKGNMKGIVYYPAKVIIKIFDIAISLFVGFLDIVGIGAKVISLSARLYGNMIAGGILLGMLVMGINAGTQNLLHIDLPLLAPLILYAQGLLVAVIQAFVFPLLVGIFIKLAQAEE